MNDSDSETCHCCGKREYRCDMLPWEPHGWVCLACADYLDGLLADAS